MNGLFIFHIFFKLVSDAFLEYFSLKFHLSLSSLRK